MDAIDLNTIKDKADELATTDVSSLQAQALDEQTKNKYGTMYFGSDEAKIKKLKAKTRYGSSRIIIGAFSPFIYLYIVVNLYNY